MQNEASGGHCEHPGPSATADAVLGGASWSDTDHERLIDGVRAGASLEDLAAGLGRTPRGVLARLAQMIAPSEGVQRAQALRWIRARLEEGDYDWRSVLAARRQRRAEARKRRRVAEQVAADRRAEATTTSIVEPEAVWCQPGDVYDIWSGLVGGSVSAETRQRFVARPELRDLCRFPQHYLTEVGRQVFHRDKVLLLAAWLDACQRGDPDNHVGDASDDDDGGMEAAQELRLAVTTAVDALTYHRQREVCIQRLGLDGAPPRTMQSIGTEYLVSRERVRQIQESAFTWITQRQQSPGKKIEDPGHTRHLVRSCAADASSFAEQVAIAADATMPGVSIVLSARVLAMLFGSSSADSKRIAEEARLALTEIRRRQDQRLRQEGFAERADRRWRRVLTDTTWPEDVGSPPPREDVTPLRSPAAQEGDHRGTWHSAKLGRDVEFESSSELLVMQTLDRATSVLWYCEQPVRLSYYFDNRPRTYYPDLLVVTADQRCVLVEVKPAFDMALSINRAKARAALDFCRRRGWGYLTTDGYRTFRQLVQRTISPDHEEVVAASLRRAGKLTYRDIKQLQSKHGFTTLDVAAMVIRQGWNLRLAPFRLDQADRSPSPWTPPPTRDNPSR